MTVLSSSIGATADRRSFWWIEAPSFDLVFFILSPLLGLAVILASGGDSNGVVPVAATMLLGFPHYLSTIVFYFWNDNRERHSARPIAFFAAPVSILAATLAVSFFHIPFVIAVVTYFWNCVHVSRQSCGIVSIYRHHGGTSLAQDKWATNFAIIATNLWFVLWRTETYPSLHRFLSLPGSSFPLFLWAASGVVAVAALSILAFNLVSRARQGRPSSPPELMLILVSILMFHPFLWLDATLATVGMLTGHFVQYLGIVWLLHRRKFGNGRGAGAPEWLRRISRSTRLLVAAVLGVAAMTLATFLCFRAVGRESWFMTMALSLVFIHFYLDGLFWAFRDPHVRRTIGPYFSPRGAA
jgi:hypothetical protein